MPQVVTKPNNRQLAFDEMRISVYADRILEGLDMLDKERLVRGVTSKLRRDEVTGDEISNAFMMSALELVTKKSRTGNLQQRDPCLLPFTKKRQQTADTNPTRTSLMVHSTR